MAATPTTTAVSTSLESAARAAISLRYVAAAQQLDFVGQGRLAHVGRPRNGLEQEEARPGRAREELPVGQGLLGQE
jgi:hypothetical protein